MGIVGLLLLILGIVAIVVWHSIILGIVLIVLALVLGGSPYYSRW